MNNTVTLTDRTGTTLHEMEDRPMTTYPTRPDHMAAWIDPDYTTSPITSKRIAMLYDPDGDAVTVTTRHAIDGTGSRIWHGEYQEWTLPTDADAIRFVDALPSLQPLFDRIRAGYECVWDGSNHIGTYSDDARLAIDEIAAWIETSAPRIPGDNAGVWYAADWYADYPASITADTTDEEIAAIAEREDTYYLDEFGAVLIDTYDYLIGIRDRLAEETGQ